MKERINIYSKQITVDFVWGYYEKTRDIITRTEEITKQNLLSGSVPTDPKFLDMNGEELENYFNELLSELDNQTSLFLFASAEAALKVDFSERVNNKKKDNVSRAFFEIYKVKKDPKNVQLDKDILETWAKEVTAAKKYIGELRGVLNFRDWLAHGRYWVPKKIGQIYDPSIIFNTIKELFKKIGIH